MDRLGYFIKAAIVLLFIDVIIVFFVEPLSTPFYLCIVTMVTCLLVIVIGFLVKKHSKNQE